jgi:hypothetical protein
MARVLWPHEAARHRRAERRAKAILKPGDRLYVGVCGGRGVTVTFVRWNETPPLEGYVVSRSLDGDEIHPSNIRKVNGVPVSFGDLRSVPECGL